MRTSRRREGILYDRSVNPEREVRVAAVLRIGPVKCRAGGGLGGVALR